MTFDPVIHPEPRLQICAFLLPSEEMAFSVLRTRLDISESSLSRQLKTLVDAGYVTSTKERGVPRPRTWVALTPRGRAAVHGHLAALNEIAAAANTDR